MPFLAGAVVLCALAVFAQSRSAANVEAEVAASTEEAAAPPPSLGDMLDLDDIHIQFAPDLIAMVLDPATGLDARIGNMRSHVATSYGMILPEIRLTDDQALLPGNYVIRI